MKAQHQGRHGGDSSPWLAVAMAAVLALSATVRAAAGFPTVAQAPPPPAAGLGHGMGPPAQRSADAHFITMMIPHHDGAIAMAELALTRARHPELKALAERIKTSQTKENAQMRQWYQQWFGGPVPAWSGAGHGMGMPGMGTSLGSLKQAQDFDRAFLEQMIAHHRMGVMMASHAQWGTVHPELRELEAAMVRVQSQEIAQMERWYQQWYGAG
jgi:uncharacterized protein (DUF305 family)